MQEFAFGEEGVGDTGLVTKDASEPGSDSLGGNDLSYELSTLTVRLRLSSPGVMLEILVQVLDGYGK